MKCLLPLVLIAFLLPTRGRTAEQPDWKQLQQLLGQPIAAKEIVDFVKTNELRKAVKGSSGSFTSPQQSYKVLFERDTVSMIALHAAPWLKDLGGTDWTPYTNALPASLSPSDSRKAVERKLGSPTEAIGQWRHGELTLWVMFNKQESAIEELYVWRTKDSP